MEGVGVKVCGLTSEEAIVALAGAGARYAGCVFFPKSPRNLDVSRAGRLAAAVPPGIRRVAVTVDATDKVLREIREAVPVDMFQLHGSESPERVAEIRDAFGLPVMKAVGVADEGDLEALAGYERVADQLLVDAKPRKGSELPGGNGIGFDWRLIAGRHWRVPWMLAGGLMACNVARAVSLTGARQVDVSSGVERAPGVKDAGLIEAFVSTAREVRRASADRVPRDP